VVLQILEEELGPEALTCLEAFIGHTPNPNHFFLAEALQRGNWVFTTNGDNLIEEAGKLRGIDIKSRVCYTDSHFEQFEEFLKSILNPQNTPGGYLFKLHGNVDEGKQGVERFGTFLLTLQQVGRGLTETKANVLNGSYKILVFVSWVTAAWMTSVYIQCLEMQIARESYSGLSMPKDQSAKLFGVRKDCKTKKMLRKGEHRGEKLGNYKCE